MPLKTPKVKFSPQLLKPFIFWASLHLDESQHESSGLSWKAGVMKRPLVLYKTAPSILTGLVRLAGNSSADMNVLRTPDGIR